MSNDQFEWQDGSVCQKMDPDVFFGAGDKMTVTEEANAKRICAGCPVADQCLNFALDTNQSWGVWGAKTEQERRRLRRGRRRAVTLASRREADARRLAHMGADTDQIAAQLGVSIRHARRLAHAGAMAS